MIYYAANSIVADTCSAIHHCLSPVGSKGLQIAKLYEQGKLIMYRWDCSRLRFASIRE